MQTKLNDDIFMATGKLKIIPSSFNHNALMMFYNNVDNQNRAIDTCWQSCDLNQEIYLTQVNTTPDFDVKNIVLGNTSEIANEPMSVIYTTKSRE